MENDKDVYGLSYSQKNIWNLEQAYPGLPLNNICTALYIEGNFRADLLEKCILYAYEVFPVLRTRITRRDGQVLQYISEERPSHVPFIDFSKTNQDGVSVWNHSAARESLPLYNAQLCQMTIFKLSENEGGIMTRVHHIIADAWSQSVVTNHIIHNYFQLLQGKETSKELTLDYKVHVEAEQNYIKSRNFERDREFWRTVLKNFPVTQIKEHSYVNVSPVGVRYSVRLSNRLNRMIASFCEQQRVSPFAVFYMGIAIYFCRMKNKKRFCIGVPTINRINFKEKQSGGMFVNTLPFVNEIDDKITFHELNDRLKEDWFKLLYHQRMPFEEIKKILVSENDIVPEQIFDLALSYQNGKIDHLRGARVTVEGRWIYSGYQAETLCIHVSSRDVSNQFLVDYDYLTQIFSEQDIEQFHAHLTQILKSALKNPDIPIKELDIIGEEEEEQLIFDFNREQMWYQREHSIGEELTEVAKACPGRAALIWEKERISYDNLVAQARKDAAGITAICEKTESVIAILMERQAEVFRWMTAIAFSGNAWLLLDSSLPEGRIQMMLEESEAELCICSEKLRGKVRQDLCRIMTPNELRNMQQTGELSQADARTLAYLVYTSGSTGRPKAVAVEHRSVLNLAVNMRELYPKGAVLSICNTSFDAFVLESMAALLNGKTIVIVREEEVNDSRKLAEYITCYGVGFIALTPSRLGAYLRDDNFRKAIRQIECIVCGGENLPAEILQSIRHLSMAKLYNQYGPSEAAVAVSHSRVTGDRPITIGRPFANCRIYILDENKKPLPTGCAGEIYIGGDCLARGYYHEEELTEERFLQDPFIPGERIYRTGDLGEWTKDGEVIFLGRKDRQLKLLGHRIEPGEVEERLCAFPDVEEAAVTVQGNHLIAFYTASKEVLSDNVLRYASQYLPRYMVPVYAKQLVEIPHTAGGKVDYKSLPEPEITNSFEGPADETEAKILAVWKKILGKDEIGVNSDYFLSGGDSLNAVVMAAELEEVFEHQLKLEEIYQNSTVRKLAHLLGGSRKEPHRDEIIRKAPRMSSYPLSASEKSFYMLHVADETKKSYHMPGIFQVEGHVDAERLNSAVSRLIEDEELLRTGFEIEGSRIVAKIYEHVEPYQTMNKASTLKEAVEEITIPFDLSKPPLFRMSVYEENEKQFLLVNMHHIISDGVSSALMMERLNAYYTGDFSEKQEIQYRDYVWSVHNNSGGCGEGLAYWKMLLKEGVPELELPSDRVRANIFDGRGRRWYFELTEEMGRALETYSREHKVTVFTVLFSAYAMLLWGLSGHQRRFAVGVPFMGRRKRELRKMLGAFVNTLPIIVEADKKQSVISLLKQVKDRVTEAIDHQEIPFEEIVHLAGITPERDKNPIYTTLFSLTPLNPDSFNLDGSKLTFIPENTQAVKVDLHLEVTPLDKGYRLAIEYAQSLFDEVTVQYFGRCYVQILEEILLCPEKELEEINMVSQGDKIRLLEQPNLIRTPYEAVCVDRMADRYACWKPKDRAICWGQDNFFTYRELKEKSDKLAQAMIEKGIERGQAVAMIPRRDGMMPVTMLGILKTGAAYVPIDPAFPQERTEYMLTNADVKAVLLGEGIDFHTDICPVYKVKELESQTNFIPLKTRQMEDTANVIFTSGSTGRPKGVMMVHRALSNLAAHTGMILGTEEDCILCASNCVFDVFTTETLLAMAAGRRISVADEEEMMLPRKMAQRIKKDNATILQFTPSRMLMSLSDAGFCEALSQIKIIILMGEPWTMALKEQLKKLTRAEIYNIYGPTETSVYNCQGEIRDEDSIHIGRPIGNCRYYLLDENRKPVMPGAKGEIYIAGECLAKGYAGRSDLTEKVFVKDPFFEGERMYKTGDVGRLRADGNWQCLGRVDSQLKLNGHRIEPEEIARQIMESKLTNEAYVVPVSENGVPQYLRACIVARPEYDKEALIKWLIKRLPDYMVPSEIIELKSIPKTASGKTDLKALQNISDLQNAASDTPKYGEEDSKEEIIRGIWQEVLNTIPRDDVSFFEQGGTSLKAIIALNHYYRYHFDMSLNDFYRFPILKDQLTMLGCGQAAVHTKEEKSKNTKEQIKAAEESRPLTIKGKVILLTGATGFLGAHLLKEFLDRGAAKVICLIRNISDIRLRETLNLYFGSDYYIKNWDRIETVCGDMCRESIGLSKERYSSLVFRTDVVVHAAADVRHYAPDEELYKSNVAGTQHMLRLAEEGKCPFVHMSTVSVAADHLVREPEKEAVFTEICLDIGQNWEDNGYTRTKFQAEELVFDAAKRGVTVKVFRIGRLMPRNSDGKFQKNPDTNAAYRLLRGLKEFGKYPEIFDRMPFEMTPVDTAAKAVAELLESNRACFHIINPKQYALGGVLKKLYDIQEVDDEAFDSGIRQKVFGGEKKVSEYIRQAAEIWVSGRQAAPKITVKADETVAELEKKGFWWEFPRLDFWGKTM